MKRIWAWLNRPGVHDWLNRYNYIAALVALLLLVLALSACKAQTVIGPCPPGQCIGPYDLTLSSHREALGL